MSDVKHESIAVLNQHFLCVLSTVNPDGKPESAIVGYVVNDKVELLIGTSNKSRKFANLQQNQAVAVVVGDTKAEVQYEGFAKEVTLQEAEGQFAKTPGTDQYKNDPDQTWWLLSPSWLRLTVHGDQNQVEEVRDFS